MVWNYFFKNYFFLIIKKMTESQCKIEEERKNKLVRNSVNILSQITTTVKVLSIEHHPKIGVNKGVWEQACEQNVPRMYKILERTVEINNIMPSGCGNALSDARSREANGNAAMDGEGHQ